MIPSYSVAAVRVARLRKIVQRVPYGNQIGTRGCGMVQIGRIFSSPGVGLGMTIPYLFQHNAISSVGTLTSGLLNVIGPKQCRHLALA